MPLSVLFVCSQNICRSVVAHTVFDYLKAKTALDTMVCSAGIWAMPDKVYYDPMMQLVAERRGYQLCKSQPTPLQTLDPVNFDYVLIFERLHFEPVKEWMGEHGRPELLTKYSKYFYNTEITVPPPMESDNLSSYMQILDLIEDSCLGLYEFIVRKDEI